MTNDKAYFLGFFSADGSNEGRSISIQLQERDDHILQDFEQMFKKEGYGTNFQSGNRIIFTKDGEERYYSRFRANSTSLCKELTSIGLPQNKTFSLSLPILEDKFMPDFIRGLIDGDGNIRERRKYLEIEIVSASESFLIDVAKWIVKNTLIGEKNIKPHDNHYRVQFYSKEAKELLDLIYNTPSNLHLTRKKIIYDNYHFTPSSRMWTKEQVEYLKAHYVPGKRGILNELSEAIGKSRKAIDKKVITLGLRQ